MPEKTGTVTGLITNPRKNNEVFGLNIDGKEYLYSFPEYRGEPFEDNLVGVGDTVRIEYQEATKAGKTKTYISVLEVQEGGVDGREPQAHQDAPGAREWGYEYRDRLTCRESCAKSATAIFAASIQAGIYKTHPDVTAVTAFAGALEKWCLEALSVQLGLQQENMPPDDEVPFE